MINKNEEKKVIPSNESKPTAAEILKKKSDEAKLAETKKGESSKSGKSSSR